MTETILEQPLFCQSLYESDSEIIVINQQNK